jgi:PPOX class probable F420-dependent enzyme
VPVTFAMFDDVVVIGIDQKPKTTLNLRRLRNIAENDRVSLLHDQYSDEWSRLWWVRADGRAEVLAEGPDRSRAVRELASRYDQYVDDPPRGPVIRVRVDRWSGWAYSG